MARVNDVGQNCSAETFFASRTDQRASNWKHAPFNAGDKSELYRINIENIWFSEDFVEQTEKWAWNSTVSLVFDVVSANKVSKRGYSNDERDILPSMYIFVYEKECFG